MKVYLESLGCKLNQCERDALALAFAQAGHTVVLEPQNADVCVINTCAVTHVAARKTRQRVRALQRLNPAAKMVATGCYVGLGADGLEADLVVDNSRKGELASLVEARIGEWALEEGRHLTAPTAARSRTRPMVKIQDGCDNACAYCIVHVLRGRARSRSRDEIVGEVADLVRSGYHEVVLTGVHVGSYGRDRGDSLSGLVGAILVHAPPDRLRLSSIEPWDLTPDFYALWQDPRMCRHLHLPLQSGCDETLRRMNRNYTAAQYADIVAQARDAIPGLAVTTDMIAGVPGETEDEFAESTAFAARMQFARMHVFAYSERPGTPAAVMPDQVDPQVRRCRAAQLREIAQRSGEAYRRRFLGCVLTVLWETRRADGHWSGLTDNYIRVYADSSEHLGNTVRPTRLTGLAPGGVHGTLA